MLGKQLQTARKQKKFNQDDVARYLDVKRQTYSAYERGVSVPDSLTLKKLADFFEVSTEYFFEYAGNITSRSGAQNEQEEKMLMLSRRADKIPPPLRERLLRNFEESIDGYLEAMGMAEESDE
ncbi:MAG: helix-turn-helix transcriptional regulator [Oscillospiraceae bacterium]|nr:helix-turn-helix transcriptional regulator [Oscillospiraceae bacterium]